MNNKDRIVDFYMTGSLRDVANSAWISTTDEIKAKSRSDEDVDRVTTFLAKNMHTSPFECVSVSIKTDDRNLLNDTLINNKFSRSEFLNKQNCYLVTIDLLNFAKVCSSFDFNLDIWKLFKEKYSDMANKVELFDFKNFDEKSEKISEEIFEKQFNVELISLHDTKNPFSTRITWRVKCPLSISVQMLRHRSGSFNMVSGRYKTIKQENVEIPNDILNIVDRDLNLSVKLDKLKSYMSQSSEKYLEFMRELKNTKNNNIITNDEYKRIREFARFVLPEGRLTELYVTFYEDDFNHFLKLRDSAHAQIEHIWIAQKMKETLEKSRQNF